MFNLLGDIAVSIGKACVARSTRLAKRRDIWLDRAELWSDRAKWLRLRGAKSLAEIRTSRGAMKR